MGKKKFSVLVADDEFWVRENLRTLIDWDKYGFLFLEPAIDGNDALDKMSKMKPDIVITDVNMPFLTGIDLIKKMRDKFPDTAVFVLSGYNDFNYVRESLLAGAIDYLLKPVDKSDLLKVLLKAVDFIIDRSKVQKEKLAAKEKLKFASSILQDQEWSQLIRRTADPQKKEQIKDSLTELDLKFSGFTLVLFRTVGPQINNKVQDLNHLVIQCKRIISEYIADSKCIVFNNVYLTNEFVLISNLEEKKLEARVLKIISEWEHFVGFRVNASFSRHYFSFLSLPDAYREAVLAQMAVKFGSFGLLIHIEDVDHVSVAKRMTSEQERQLEFAVQTMNGNLFRETVLHGIGLEEIKNWRMVEVHQTFKSIIWILHKNYGYVHASPSQILTTDHLSELLFQAVDNHDGDEALNIFSELLDEFFDSSTPEGLSESMQKTIQNIRDFINRHYFEELSLSSLARRFHVESSYLSRSFKQATGSNLMLYIANERIKHAEKYLKQERLNITEIAQLIGYSDYGYFSRVFRKIVGKSPREYRDSFAKGKSAKS